MMKNMGKGAESHEEPPKKAEPKAEPKPQPKKEPESPDVELKNKGN